MRHFIKAVPAAVAILAAPLAGQAPSFGLIGGMTSSKIAISGNGNTLTFDSRTGFAAGGSLRLPISTAAELELNALYSQKGFKVDLEDASGEMKLGYVEVPVLLSYGFAPPAATVRPFLLGGVSLGFKAGCDLSGTGDEGTISASCDDFLDAEQKGVDLGITWGAGIRYNRLSAQIRYTLGMTEVFDDNDDTISTRNRTLYLLAGFSF